MLIRGSLINLEKWVRLRDLPVKQAPAVDRKIVSCFDLPYSHDAFKKARDGYQSLGTLKYPEIFNAIAGATEGTTLKAKGSLHIDVPEKLKEFVSRSMAYEFKNSSCFKEKYVNLVVRRSNINAPAQRKHTDPVKKSQGRLFHIYMLATSQPTVFPGYPPSQNYEIIMATSASRHYRPSLEGGGERIWAALIVST